MRRGALILWLVLVAADALAQFSGSASLVSNYRFRGLSLSDNEPAAQLGVAYDDARGWYTGAFVSTVEFAPSGVELQAVPFVGYAWRTAAGPTWEAGADYSAFTGHARDRNYPEFYVGVASEKLNARLYYSSRYLGQDTATVYGEVNASELLREGIRLLAHFGILRSTGGALYYRGPDRLLDGRVGIGLDVEPFNVQLSWIGINAAAASYELTGARSHNGVVLSVSRSF